MPHVKQHTPNLQQVANTTNISDDRLTRFMRTELSSEQIRKVLDSQTRSAQAVRAQALFAGSMW